MKTYVVDGQKFSTLEEFAEHFSLRVLEGFHHWKGHLDAFEDILRGGFGIPEEGFRLVWEHSDLSRKRLGYSETVRQLELRLMQCHPLNRESVTEQLRDARDGKGTTVFDWLVEIIQSHEAEDGIVLELR